VFDLDGTLLDGTVVAPAAAAWTFGWGCRPLLVRVRSRCRAPRPGL